MWEHTTEQMLGLEMVAELALESEFGLAIAMVPVSVLVLVLGLEIGWDSVTEHTLETELVFDLVSVLEVT